MNRSSSSLQHVGKVHSGLVMLAALALAGWMLWPEARSTNVAGNRSNTLRLAEERSTDSQVVADLETPCELRGEGLLHQPDGSWCLLVSVHRPGTEGVDELALRNLRIDGVPLEGYEVLMPPKPYGNPLDVPILIRELPLDRSAVVFSYELDFQSLHHGRPARYVATGEFELPLGEP